MYNLTILKDPAPKEVYQKMMSLQDKTGSWVEFYENGKVTGTRYRPWETAINIEAAITYAESFQ